MLDGESEFELLCRRPSSAPAADVRAALRELRARLSPRERSAPRAGRLLADRAGPAPRPRPPRAVEGGGEDVLDRVGGDERRAPARVSGGSSSRSLSFSRGKMTRLSPARCAASDFSRMPPIGSTWPVSVISPVMPTSSATGSLRTSEASAVAIVTPAEGPSFGTAPAGTWMWTSCSSNQPSGSPSWSACERTHESAARADSCITSPSWPVTVSLPLPG